MRNDWPDPLTGTDGRKVTTADQWPKRRDELLALFAKEMYGEPLPPSDVKVEPLRDEPLGRVGMLRELRVHTGLLGPVTAQLLVPTRPGPAPTFIVLNFNGNYKTRTGEGAWPLETIALRGYGVLTVCYEELAPDRKDAPLYRTAHRAISLWAWGMSRLVDAIAALPECDPKRLIALGHSRLGKTALLAGARDPRFTAVIANQSGCGGAAPSRGTVGESVQRINTVFPHWFADSFKRYNERPQALPFDQHALVACCAPRPVLLTCAQDDTWANPVGQFEVLQAADPVYRLVAGGGLDASAMPPLNTLSAGKLGYWIRPGAHAMSPTDWATYLDWTDRQLPR